MKKDFNIIDINLETIWDESLQYNSNIDDQGNKSRFEEIVNFNESDSSNNTEIENTIHLYDINFQSKQQEEQLEKVICQIKNIFLFLENVIKNDKNFNKEEDFYVILFLLCIYNEKLLIIKNLNSDFKNQIIKILETLEYWDNRIEEMPSHILKKWDANEEHLLGDLKYSNIIDFFKNILYKFDENDIQKIIKLLIGINKNILSKNFTKVFDIVLKKISIFFNQESIFEPINLTNFVNNLAKIEKGYKIFSPYAGICSLGVNMDEKGVYYTAYEYNRLNWIIGTLRLIAYNKPKKSVIYENWEKQEFLNIVYSNVNGLENWQKDFEGTYNDEGEYELYETPKKFDLIIIDPCFRKDDFFQIEDGYKFLKEDGKIIIYSYNQNVKNDLQKYFDDNLIELIIDFPQGIKIKDFPLYIIILSKNRKDNKTIKLLRTNNFIKSNDLGYEILDFSSLISILENNIEDNENLRYINLEQVKENDYCVNSELYFLENIDGTQLKEILEPVGKVYSISKYKKPFDIDVEGYIPLNELPEKGKFISLNILNNGYSRYLSNLSNLEDIILNNYSDVRCIQESCLLMPRVGSNKLIPIYFKYNNEPIFINTPILSYKIKKEVEKNIDIDYILYEFENQYIQKRISAYKSAPNSFLFKDDFKKIKIKLPSIEEQRSKVEGFKMGEKEIQNLEQEKLEIFKINESDKYNEFRSLKHTILNCLSNIKSSNILLFDKIKNIVTDLSIIEEMIQLQMDIKMDIQTISKLLDKGDNGINLKDYPKKFIAIDDLINNIVTI